LLTGFRFHAGMIKHSPLFQTVDLEQAENDARLAVEALADGLAGLLRAAVALVGTGGAVDLEGLDRMTGLVCARALDLPPDHGRRVQPQLIALRTDLDVLSAALACTPPN
jgi:hypothetical protein